jgi:hypothetical protein
MFEHDTACTTEILGREAEVRCWNSRHLRVLYASSNVFSGVVALQWRSQIETHATSNLHSATVLRSYAKAAMTRPSTEFTGRISATASYQSIVRKF